jgi:hypothetical protein
MSLSLHFFFFYKSFHKFSLVSHFSDHQVSSFRPLFIPMRCVFCLVTFFCHAGYSCSITPLNSYCTLYYPTSCLPLIYLLHLIVFFLFFQKKKIFLFHLTPTIYTMYNSTFLQLLSVTRSNIPIHFHSNTIHQSLHLFLC